MAEFVIDSRTKIVMPHAAEVEYLASHMRRADVAEIYALSGWTPMHALIFSINHSDMVMCAIHDSVPAVIWGVHVPSVLYREGMPWMLGTTAIENNAKRFLRQSLLWRDEMLDKYGTLANLVDERNVVSKRWLKWLGFTIDPPINVGFERRLFHRFHLEAP